MSEGGAVMRCDIQPHHLAPNGFLHAGSVITLADTAAGFGCVGNWPEGATGFTTIELKTNFLGTLVEGGWSPVLSRSTAKLALPMIRHARLPWVVSVYC